MPLQKNQVLTLTIERLSNDGSGVAHSPDGEAVFIPGTAPGDVASIRIVKDCGRYAFGILDAIQTSSPDRIPVDCTVAGPCGGCSLRHLDYTAELRAKGESVTDAFRRIGGLDVPVLPPLPSPEIDRYRNKVQFPVGLDKNGKPCIGFYAGRTHRIVPCPDCKLQPDVLNEIGNTLCAFFAAHDIQPYDEQTSKGLVRHVFLRRGAHSGQIMVCLVCTRAKLPHAEKLCRALTAQYADIATILINVNVRNTNVILGSETHTLYGPGFIEDTLCGVPVQLGPLSFYQVNTLAAERLYGIAAEYAQLTPDDLLLDNPAYLASLLIYLQSKNIAFPSRLQRLLGAKKLPSMNVQWMERLLQGFLYDDVDSYLCDKVYRELLIADLKSSGLIEKKKVVMTKSAAVEKMLTNSLGKCNSIRDIVFHEYETSGQNLRLLVLTDYIRKEYEKAIGNTEYDVNSLGVLPFFEMLRRENEKKNKQIRFGVLCGTIVIIPAEAKEALEQEIGTSGKVTFSRIGNLPETDYLKVTAVGNAHFLTGAVTNVFSKGYMQVLVGTKSLLGEGWDSPCINSLILASFVGSFMLSNQMRGRAIRVMKEQPEKTSNIWHLVCLRPWDEVLKADDNQISEDYSMLERRMEHFLGLHYTENTIENGIKRLSIIKTPFNKTNIDRINRQMLKMSGQRDMLKKRWDSALAIYDKMDIVDETEVKDKFVTSVVFWDAILTMILSAILFLIGAIGAGVVAGASRNGHLAGICYFFIVVGLTGIMIRFPKIFMLWSPLKRLKAFGNGIRKALEEQQLLEETHCKVVAESPGPDNHIIYLSGGSGRDKALFAQCVNEFFDVIDNQRYILVKKKGRKGLNGFYAIPNCFSKKKEDAECFAKCMHPYIGGYDCVYTRNEKGRELLLEGRVKALANREERCISHKKVKGALE